MNMQSTETERLLLIEKKAEICRLSLEILEIIHQETTSRDDIVDVKKRMIQILSLLHTLAAYGSPGRNLNEVMKLVVRFCQLQGRERDDFISGVPVAELFCITVNAIEFSYSWMPVIVKTPIPPFDILRKT